MKPDSLPGEIDVTVPEADACRRLQQLNPYVRQCGDEWRPNWILRGRRLFDYLLVLFPKGKGEAVVGTDHYDIEPGDLFWVPPNTYHEMRGDVYCQYIHCDLIYDPARSHWDAFVPEGLVDITPWSEHIHPPVDDPMLAAWEGRVLRGASMQVAELFGTTCRTHIRSREKAMLESSASLKLLLCHIMAERESTVGGQKAHHRVKMLRAAELIRTAPTEILSVPNLAREFGYSESHFRRLFRSYHGVSPHRMHQQARCHKACEWLTYSPRSISEIAQDLGFKSVHNFSRTFRQWMKQTPSHYRARESS